MNNSEFSISEWDRKNKAYRENKSDAIDSRYFDLYKGDKLNGLHLVAFWYGDDPEDSDTLMQSATNNYNLQLDVLESCNTKKQLQEILTSCMWNDQHP